MILLVLLVSCIITYISYGLSLQMLYYIGLTMILAKIVILDYREHLIDDRHLITAFLWCAGYRALIGTYLPGLYGLAAAAGIALVIYICASIIQHIKNEAAVGSGDYLLILVIGWIYGMYGLVAILFYGLLVGNIVLLLMRYFKSNDIREIPFAPILATGIIANAILPHNFWFSLMKMV